MKTSLSIRIDAPPEHVFALARDVGRWPELLPHYRSVAVESRRGERALARMVAVRMLGPVPVPVTWRAEQWADASDRSDLRLRFLHVRGVTRGMDVTWHIRPGADGGAHVTIEHSFSRALPMLGPEALPRVVDRFFTRPIASRTLRTFKRLAEAAFAERPGSPVPANGPV